jgi:hypothetical protein
MMGKNFYISYFFFMKKILLALGTLLVLTTVWFANHSFAASKALLWTVTDKDNQEWCRFPFQTPQQDGILDEHKQLAKENRNEWVLCSDYNIDKTDAQILEQYDVGTPVGNADLNWRNICMKRGLEIPCLSLNENSSELFWSGKITGQSVNKSSLNSSWASLWECKVNGKPVDCEEMMQDVELIP